MISESESNGYSSGPMISQDSSMNNVANIASNFKTQENLGQRKAYSDKNVAYYGQINKDAKKPEEEEGVFSRFINFITSPWRIEEEEYIDAHGFKCKRPKEKIPLRKKSDKLEDDINKAGGDSLSYATQNSGFGKIFL